MSSRKGEREFILLATDFSVPAQRAYLYALNLASLFKARLVILTVLKAVPWAGGSAASPFAADGGLARVGETGPTRAGGWPQPDADVGSRKSIGLHL